MTKADCQALANLFARMDTDIGLRPINETELRLVRAAYEEAVRERDVAQAALDENIITMSDDAVIACAVRDYKSASKAAEAAHKTKVVALSAIINSYKKERDELHRRLDAQDKVVEELRSKLRNFAFERRQVMRTGGAFEDIGVHCKACGSDWDFGQPETHKTGCIFALDAFCAAPQSTPTSNT